MSYVQEGEQLEEGQEVSEREQSSEFVITKGAGRKELCEVCEAALMKYTCPKCGRKSCGISCLNKHKKNNHCSGIADPFVMLDHKRIEEKDVQKDFHFVKDMLSNADKVKKTLSGVNAFDQEPKRFKIMRINAKRLYNINLLNAPSIIERHRQNISFYFVKTKTFYWVLQLLYWRVEEEDKEVCSRVLTPPTADSDKLIQIMPDSFLCRDLLEKGINTQKKQEFCVFVQKKSRNSKTKTAIELDKEFALRDCLINHTIYEFPTLIFVHNTFRQKYLSLRQIPLEN